LKDLFWNFECGGKRRTQKAVVCLLLKKQPKMPAGEREESFKGGGSVSENLCYTSPAWFGKRNYEIPYGGSRGSPYV